MLKIKKTHQRPTALRLVLSSRLSPGRGHQVIIWADPQLVFRLRVVAKSTCSKSSKLSCLPPISHHNKRSRFTLSYSLSKTSFILNLAVAVVVISRLFLHLVGNFFTFGVLIPLVRLYHRYYFCPCALSREIVVSTTLAHACFSFKCSLLIRALTVSA